MKTIEGYTIENFKKLETPIVVGILNPRTYIYEGTIKNVPFGTIKKDCATIWDKFGKCPNLDAPDCFLDFDNKSTLSTSELLFNKLKDTMIEYCSLDNESSLENEIESHIKMYEKYIRRRKTNNDEN